MKKYMFGMGDGGAANARALLELGYDAVVLSGGDASAFGVAREAGLEAYLCYGAHSLGDFARGEHGAKDAFGGDATWFGSGCPNSREIVAARMDAAFDIAARVEGISGIFVDGARFASFASEEGERAFFGCFCERCVEMMGETATRDGVRELYSFLNGGKGDMARMKKAVGDWLKFRADCVKRYMDMFAERARQMGVASGAFVFAPSLARFVGQEYSGLESVDIVAPMFYRDYPHKSGTACLGHEWAAFSDMLSRANVPARMLAREIFGTELHSAPFTPEYVGRETALARKALREGQLLAPIVQTEDEMLDETLALVMSSGADACGEFMFSQKKFK